MTIPIVALDVSTYDDAMAIVAQLGDSCYFYKVGGELFTAEGPRIVKAVRDAGCEVFLDLKFHDIPNTVRKSAASAARLGASLITVHASGGEAMVAAAVEGASSSAQSCRVLAVTILTSFTDQAIAAAWGREQVDMTADVVRLANIARAGGAHGVVCSGHEIGPLRSAFGDSLALLVPGIRLPGAPTGDQARIMTPAAATSAGATYIILGRTVTQAPDPVAAMGAVLAEIGSVSAQNR